MSERFTDIEALMAEINGPLRKDVEETVFNASRQRGEERIKNGATKAPEAGRKARAKEKHVRRTDGSTETK